MKKHVINDNAAEGLYSFTCEINARWMKILETIPDFSGIGNSVADLIRERDAYLRARAILREYDMFPVDFQKSVQLKRAIGRMRRKADGFSGQCQISLLHQVCILQHDSILQKRFFHTLIRTPNNVNSRRALAQRLKNTMNHLELLIPLALMMGVDLEGILIAVNRNVHQINRLACQELRILPLKPFPIEQFYPGIRAGTIGNET